MNPKLAITPELALELVTTYHAFKSGEISDKAGLTQNDFLRIIKAIGQQWGYETIEKIIEELQKIADGSLLAQAEIPINLQELVKDYEKWEALRKQAKLTPEINFSLQVQSQILNRDLERIEEVQPQKPVEKLDQWIQEEHANQIARLLNQATLGATESPQEGEQVTTPSKDGKRPKINIVAQEIETAIKEHLARNPDLSTEEIGQIITSTLAKQQLSLAPDQISRAIELVSSAVHHQTTQQPFDIEQPINRQPLLIRKPTPAPIQTEEAKEEPTKTEKRAEEDLLYLLYRPDTVQNRILRQLSLFFGKKGTSTREQLEIALQRFEIENPKIVAKNPLALQVLKEKVNQLAIEEIKENVLGAEILPGSLLTKEKIDTGLKIFRIEIDPGNKTIHLHPQIPQLGDVLMVRKYLAGESRSFLQNFVSNLNLSLGRIVNSQQLRSLFSNFGSKILQPLFSWGGSLLSSAGKALAVNGSRVMLALLGTGAGQIAGAAILVAIIIIFGVVAILSLLNINTSQSTLLKQGTDLGIIPESQYIGLSKTADVSAYSGPLPKEVHYTITISAKDKKLTNISAHENFSVFSSHGNPPAPISSLPSLPNTLEVGQSTTVSFSLTFTDTYRDSVITNSITIRADVDGGPRGESITRSASVVLGNPPTSCFNFIDSWDPSEQAAVIETIGKISRSTAYSGGLCSGLGGTKSVRIRRIRSNPGWAGEVTEGDLITLYERAFTSPYNLFYTMSHESGHVYGNRNGSVYIAFAQEVAPSINEAYIPTYTLTKSPGEDFAETIAVYIIRKEVPTLSGYNISAMPNTWPKHYTFAKNNIFAGFDGF